MSDNPLDRVVAEILPRQRFVVAAHARPDGDAVGSQLAMAYALRYLGKSARVVSRDPAPNAMAGFPGIEDIEILEHVDDPGDAVIVMESGDLTRTGITGLERGFVINIDHHVGNTQYGAVNWLDLSAAACGEMVFTLIQCLGVPISTEIALHVYAAILTDTGSFHYSSISPRTFDICRQCVEAGVHAETVARNIYDSNNLGRLRLFGAVLSRMVLDPSGRVAAIAVDRRLAEECGGTYEDTDGLVNLPLTVKDIVAVVFFKEIDDNQWRVSLRSKGTVDVNVVAAAFGGGGHKNASGCGAAGQLNELTNLFIRRVLEQVNTRQHPATSA